MDEAVATQLSWSEEKREAMRVEQACFHNQNRGEERGHYSQVFVQAVNLWKTTPRMRKLVLDPSIGKIAAEAGQCSGIHLYHDHALIKQPWAPATNWHIGKCSRSLCVFFRSLTEAAAQTLPAIRSRPSTR